MKSFLSACLAILVLLPSIVDAQYVPLIGIPGLSGNAQIGEYVNAIFYLAIIVGAILAVFRLIIAGVQWMFSDVITTKQQAIVNIRGAFLGLLILIGMTVVFREINPDILRLDVLSTGARLERQSVSQQPATTRTAVNQTQSRTVCSDEVGKTCADLEAACRADRAFIAVETKGNTVICLRDRNEMTGEDRRSDEVDEFVRTALNTFFTTEGSPLFGKKLITYYNERSDFSVENVPTYTKECTDAGNEFVSQPVPSSGIAYLCVK